MVCSLFFKCSFVLRVGAVIFELDKVSMSNFVMFKFWSMTLKIEGVFEKMNKIFSKKLAKRTLNLVSKKDPNQCKISYMRKKYIFCKIQSLYTINNLSVVMEIISSYFPYGLKKMSRYTLSAPQPDSASYIGGGIWARGVPAEHGGHPALLEAGLDRRLGKEGG